MRPAFRDESCPSRGRGCPQRSPRRPRDGSGQGPHVERHVFLTPVPHQPCARGAAAVPVVLRKAFGTWQGITASRRLPEHMRVGLLAGSDGIDRRSSRRHARRVVLGEYDHVLTCDKSVGTYQTYQQQTCMQAHTPRTQRSWQARGTDRVPNDGSNCNHAAVLMTI